MGGQPTCCIRIDFKKIDAAVVQVSKPVGNSRH